MVQKIIQKMRNMTAKHRGMFKPGGYEFVDFHTGFEGRATENIGTFVLLFVLVSLLTTGCTLIAA